MGWVIIYCIGAFITFILSAIALSDPFEADTIPGAILMAAMWPVFIWWAIVRLAGR